MKYNNAGKSSRIPTGVGPDQISCIGDGVG